MPGGTVSNIKDDPQAYLKLFCPFQCKGNVANYCDGDSCSLFIVRTALVGRKVVFSGCSIKWLAICADRF